MKCRRRRRIGGEERGKRTYTSHTECAIPSSVCVRSNVHRRQTLPEYEMAIRVKRQVALVHQQYIEYRVRLSLCLCVCMLCANLISLLISMPWTGDQTATVGTHTHSHYVQCWQCTHTSKIMLIWPCGEQITAKCLSSSSW